MPVTDPRISTVRLPASDRRRQLVETALDGFSRKGFGGTTTKEIPAAAAVTEAIIFRHFPNKQDLYTAALEHHHNSAQLADCRARTVMTGASHTRSAIGDGADTFGGILMRGSRGHPQPQRAT